MISLLVTTLHTIDAPLPQVVFLRKNTYKLKKHDFSCLIANVLVSEAFNLARGDLFRFHSDPIKVGCGSHRRTPTAMHRKWFNSRI